MVGTHKALKLITIEQLFVLISKILILLSNIMHDIDNLKECVRRRVMKSMSANPYCSEAASRDAMEAVWDVCYNDTKPFDRAP